MTERALPMDARSRRFSRQRDFARRFSRRPAGMVSLGVILLVLFCAIFTELVATHDPIETDFDALFARTSGDHFLGTDNLGRDTFSRIVHGARTAILVGLISVGIGWASACRTGCCRATWAVSRTKR